MMIKRLLLASIVFALGQAPIRAEETLKSGHVLGNGTSSERAPADTSLITIMGQSGSGLGSGISTLLAGAPNTASNLLAAPSAVCPAGQFLTWSTLSSPQTCATPSGGGGGSGTVSSAPLGDLAYYAALGTTVSGIVPGANVVASLKQPSFDLRAIFTPGGTDNYAAGAAWMATAPVGMFSLNSPTTTNIVEYYFSGSLGLEDLGLNIDCGGGGFRADNVHLVFAAGVDGVIEDYGSTVDVRGCAIVSLGIFASSGPITSGITVIPAVASFATTSLTIPFFGAGDGVIMLGGTKTDVALLTPPGAYLASVSGTSVTLATGFATTATPVYESAYLFRLPAALASTVTTTTGSATVTTTGGPYLFLPGDLIWSDAFPYGTTVNTVSGSVGAQTITMDNAYLDAATLATKTHTSGSGKMWLVPASFKRRASGQSHNVYSIGWPVGLQMSCSANGSDNCDNSRDYGFGSERSIVGRWVGGNNTGSSLSVGAFYNTSLRYGLFEGGTLGSYYIGETHEGYESGTAYTDVVLNCNDSNNSTFSGYYQNSPNGSCGNSTDPYNVNPSNPAEGGTVKALSIGPTSVSIAGLPSLTGNAFSGAFLYVDATVAGGYIYNTVLIANLNPCSTFAGSTQVVSNGVAVSVSGYGVAVSATGAAKRKVFCDGVSWTYN
jgi:hypothetical protein